MKRGEKRLTISTKGRYALRMLADLALHGSEGCVALKDIAYRQNISKKYLEQIVPSLVRSKLLYANRGYGGGYSLSKPPEQYTVGEILRVTEGSLCPVACLQCEPNNCPRKDECLTLPVWEGLNRVINEYLDGITLKSIISGRSEKKI